MERRTEGYEGWKEGRNESKQVGREETKKEKEEFIYTDIYIYIYIYRYRYIEIIR
jgi:hypothetical protein